MLVRVYDKQADHYFKSEVYAVINTGYYERHLVIAPTAQGDGFLFCDYLDKTTEGLPVLINTVMNQKPTDWIHKRTSDVDSVFEAYQNRLNKDVRFFEYFGFPWLFQDAEVMARLLNGETVLVRETNYTGYLYSDLSEKGWHYVQTQEDANDFIKEVSGFHDSVIKELHYISGAYMTEDRSLQPCDNIRCISMQIQSQWCGNIDLIFEGVTALNLRPSSDNYAGNIFEASFIFEKETVYFFDDFVEEVDELHSGTWISAYSLRWKFSS